MCSLWSAEDAAFVSRKRLQVVADNLDTTLLRGSMLQASAGLILSGVFTFVVIRN